MAARFAQDFLTKRAGRACLSCRSRKIRCNVEDTGPPCSNCLTDDIDCVTAKSKRGKKPYRRLKNNPRRSGTKDGSTAEDILAPVKSNANGQRQTVPLSKVSPTHTAGWLDDSVELDVLSQCHVEAAPKRPAAQLDQRFLHQELTYASLFDADTAVHPWPTTAALTPRSLSTAPRASPSAESFRTNHDGLPDFIRPLSPSLSQDDVNYLRIKGALDVPAPNFLKALLAAYVQFVHPMMPTLDLSCCRGILAGDSASISILPLQAIAFASVPFVDLSDIRKAGFTSRRACRKAFYDKTRLLYDHDVGSDKLAIIQAVLLMAYWSEKPGDNRGAWYWMGIAITLAQTLGMHRKAEYKVQSPETSLRKRVWWSCYIRDRMLGIALGRPLRIRDAEFDTPPLTLEDFDMLNPSEGPAETIFPSVDDQIALAEMCIHAAELCKLSRKVLELHFSVLPNEHNTSTAIGDNGSTATMLFLKSSPSPSEKQLAQIYDDELQAFYSRLPSSCVCQVPAGAGQAGVSSSPGVIANAAYLHIAFWSVVSALHRPQLRNGDKAISIKRVEEAAIEVSRVDREMHQAGLDRYLPATAGIPFQFTAFITHTKRLEYKTKMEDVTEVLDSLFFCIKVLETSREAFPGGDAGGDFLTFIASKANVTLLFNQESKLWGVEYHGVHVCPKSRQQLSLETSNNTLSGSGFGLPRQSPVIMSEQKTPPKTANNNAESPDPDRDPDPQVLLFDHIDAIDWSGLADFLPGCNMDYDHVFGTMVNLDCYLQDVEMR